MSDINGDHLFFVYLASLPLGNCPSHIPTWSMFCEPRFLSGPKEKVEFLSLATQTVLFKLHNSLLQSSIQQDSKETFRDVKKIFLPCNPRIVSAKICAFIYLHFLCKPFSYVQHLNIQVPTVHPPSNVPHIILIVLSPKSPLIIWHDYSPNQKLKWYPWHLPLPYCSFFYNSIGAICFPSNTSQFKASSLIIPSSPTLQLFWFVMFPLSSSLS